MLRIHGKDLDFALLNSKTSVALELFSRWSAGAPFLKQPKADHKPVGDFIFLVPAGSATLELNQQPQGLEGPVMVHFNTLQGMQGPLALKAAPTWVKPAADPPVKVKTLEAAGEKLRRALAEQGVQPAPNQCRPAPIRALRIMAAYAGVALDEPAAGVAALYDDKSAEVRAAGITALEHYIGRGAVEDVRLYKVLMARQIKSGQASIIMEMLHGLGSEGACVRRPMKP